MAITKIKLVGFEKLARTNINFFAQMKLRNRWVIGKEAKRLSLQMKQVAPHDTYNLRNAIESREFINKPTGVVGAVVGITKETSRQHPEFRVGKNGQGWYPAFQEYGFYDRAGKYIRNSFVRPIMLGNRVKIKKTIKDAYNQIIKNRHLWAER